MKYLLPQLVVVICVWTCPAFGRDLTLEPGHLKPFGEARPSHPVEEMDKFPNPRYFFENYVKPLKPLKMVGAAKYSPAFKKWTDDYFLEQKGSYMHKIASETVKKENRNQEVKDIIFADFLKTYNKSENYMVDGVPPFLREDIVIPCPLQCGTLLDDHLVENIMWFSSGGTKSVVHTDSVDNINCLYRGQKTLVFVDPEKYGDKVDMDRPHGAYCNVDVDSVDYTKYPGLADVEFQHVTLNAGDCLYIPYKWIHQVRSMGSNLAVNIWWRHHLTKEIDFTQCTDPCDLRLTLEEANFRGFDDAFEDLTVEEVREHLLSMAQTGHDLTSEDFLNSLLQDGVAIARENPDLEDMIIEMFSIVDMNKDAVVTRTEIKEAPDEVLEELLPIMKDIYQMLGEGDEGDMEYMDEDDGHYDDEIDIDQDLEEDKIDPGDSDEVDLHDEL